MFRKHTERCSQHGACWWYFICSGQQSQPSALDDVMTKSKSKSKVKDFYYNKIIIIHRMTQRLKPIWIYLSQPWGWWFVTPSCPLWHKTLSALLALCEENPLFTISFCFQRLSNAGFGVFFGVSSVDFFGNWTLWNKLQWNLKQRTCMPVFTEQLAYAISQSGEICSIPSVIIPYRQRSVQWIQQTSTTTMPLECHYCIIWIIFTHSVIVA